MSEPKYKAKVTKNKPIVFTDTIDSHFKAYPHKDCTCFVEVPQFSCFDLTEIVTFEVGKKYRITIELL